VCALIKQHVSVDLSREIFFNGQNLVQNNIKHDNIIEFFVSIDDRH